MSFFQNNSNDTMPIGGDMSLWNATASNEDRTQWLQHIAHQNQQEQKVTAMQDQNSGNHLLYSSIQPSLYHLQPDFSDAQIDVAKNEERKESSTHNYRDYANCNERIEICTKGGVKVPFPVVLYNMLEHIDLKEPQLAKIISWQPHGRCFVTHNPKKFEDEVLPRFFKQKHYASFRRQLNLWGFKRLTQSGPDNGAYYHEMFLRSKTYLCRGIERLANGSGNARGPANPDGEPKFFTMEPLPPSAEQSHEDNIMPCTEHMQKNLPKRESFNSNSEHLTVISSASIHNVSASPSTDSIHSSKPGSSNNFEENQTRHTTSATANDANQILMCNLSNLSKLQSQIQEAQARLTGGELLQGESANQLNNILLSGNNQAANQCTPFNFEGVRHQGPYFNSNQQAHLQPNTLQNLHAIQHQLLSESPGTSLRNIFETNASNALNPFENSNLSRRSLLDGSFNDSIEISNLAPINEQEMKAINAQDKSKIFDV